MKKEMLINVLQQEECRIAIVEEGVLEELYVERASQESYVGNIYKGRIVNIEPSIQAAFVDFGIGRNGFLHVSDVDPAYYKHLLSKEDLAAYEADMDRQYDSSGRSRDRDRANRGGRERDRQPRQMTAWLEPQAVPPPTNGEEFAPEEDFATGIGDEIFPTPNNGYGTTDELVAEDANIESTPAAEDEAATDTFAEGLSSVEEPPLPERRDRPAAAPKPKKTHKPLPPPPVEDEDFGAGIVEAEEIANAAVDDTETVQAIESLEGGDPVMVNDDTAMETGEADSGTEEPTLRKPRTRRSRPRNEESAGEQTENKPRNRRKKNDDERPDDRPKYMDSAEHRTWPDDEEGEIKPFFDENGTPDFDPEAPNDRFSDASPELTEETPAPAESEEPFERFSGDPEPAEAAEEEAREFAHEAEDAVLQDPEPEVTGRGFNDDFSSGRRDRDRGPRARSRGGREGGRESDRGRDRERGSRDRGPRGGFKSGPGGPKGGRDRGLPKPPIQEIFKRGQEVIVQVIKEAVGTKGPTLSTYVSIAGRYLVLMPSLNRVGVSRKIEDHDARRRLREIMNTLSPPKGVGFIVRTAAVDRDAKELQNDLGYLLRLWQVVVKRIRRVAGPVEIYRESDMITRTIRDIFTSDIDTIWVDEETAFAHASEFLQIVMPKFAARIRYFEHSEPLFHRYAIEDEIAKIYQKRIDMPLGGSLVIEQTEALVAIDVNSGNFRADNNAEETAFQMNLHAAKEIARQLRLRDLGGVIVNDFIDMKSESHRRKLEDAFREALRRDRARTKILRISQFGLIEMTRQRIRPSLKRSIFQDCAHCRGNGFVKTSESLAIEVMRLLQLAAHRAPSVQLVQVTVHPDTAHYLLNKRRKDIASLEEQGKLEVQISGQLGVSPEMLQVRCFDHNGNEVRLLPPVPPPKLAGGRIGRDERGARGRGNRDERRYPQPLD